MTSTFIVKHSSIVVPNYIPGSCQKLEENLSIWDDLYFRYKGVGFQYDEDSQTLYLPRGLDIGYLESLLNRRAEIDYNYNDEEHVTIRLKTEPRNDIQQRSIAYLLGEGSKFGYTKTKSQLALTLQTGDGKSYCVVAALSFMRTKSLILTHVDNIKQQWISSFKQFTNIQEDYMLDIKGSKVIEKIMKMDGPLPWKVYFVNRKTFQSYAKKHGWDAVDEFIKKIKIGVKVFDEAHIEFETMMHIDFHTNVKKTFYLTANFERSDFKENKVFKLCFKNIPKFGTEASKEKDRHIVYVPVFFNSHPSLEDKMGVKGIKGWLDKNKYSDYLMKKDSFFEILDKALDMLKLEGESSRLLVLSSKIDSTYYIESFLKEKYNGKDIGIYNSKIDDKVKEHVKAECDIISSTPKSMGTGTDIPELRYVINIEPYSSAVQANQMAGRLRALQNGNKTFFFELIDEGFPEITRMYKKRLPVFKKKCVQIMEIKF